MPFNPSIVGGGIYTSAANTWTATQTFSSSLNLSIPLTTLTGTTSGSIIWAMPLQGSSYKYFIAFFNAYENNTTTNQTINFPTAFTQSPVLSNSVAGLTVTATTTQLTVVAPDNTSTYSGWVIVEGF